MVAGSGEAAAVAGGPLKARPALAAAAPTALKDQIGAVTGKLDTMDAERQHLLTR